MKGARKRRKPERARSEPPAPRAPEEAGGAGAAASGLKVHPGLLARLNGPRAGFNRPLTAGLAALMLALFVAPFLTYAAAPGLEPLSSLACPPDHRLVRVQATQIMPSEQLSARTLRALWLGCANGRGEVLASREPHDRLMTRAWLALALLFFPIILLLIDRKLGGPGRLSAGGGRRSPGAGPAAGGPRRPGAPAGGGGRR